MTFAHTFHPDEKWRFFFPPLLYFMPGILPACSAAGKLRWKSVSRSTVYLCMAIHSLLLQAILLLQIKLFTEEDGWWKGTPFIWCLTSSLSSLFPPTSFRPNWALCTTWNEDSKLLLSNLCSPNYFPFRKWWSSILTSRVRGLRPPHNPSETTHHYPIINWSQLEPQSSC